MSGVRSTSTRSSSRVTRSSAARLREEDSVLEIGSSQPIRRRGRTRTTTLGLQRHSPYTLPQMSNAEDITVNTPEFRAPLVDLTCEAEEEVSRDEVFILGEDIARPPRLVPIDLRSQTTTGRNSIDETIILDMDSDVEDKDDTPNLANVPLNERVTSAGSPESVLTCPICFDSLAQIKQQNKQVYSTVCGHLFCHICIAAAVRTSRQCPTCRKRINQRQIHPIFI